MKRLFPILLGALIGISYSFTVDAQGLSKGGKKVEFTFPDSISANKTMLFPTFQSVSSESADTVNIDIEEFYTYYTVTDTMTANMVVNVDIASHVTAGSLLYLRAIADDNDLTITFGDGLQAPVFTTDSMSYRTHLFIYTGSTFLNVGSGLND